MTEAENKTDDTTGRAVLRHSCRLPVRYRILRSVPSMGIYRQRDVYEEGWIRNRSHAGILLEVPHYIQEGQLLEINFKSPDGSATYRAEAVVRWVTKQADRDFHVGLKFRNILQI